MLRRLRGRLALLAAGLTGTVVLAVCLLSFLLLRAQYRESRELAFRLASGAVQTQWTVEDAISVPWLRSSMEANGTRIVVWENNALLYPGSSDRETAAQLKAARPQGDTSLYYAAGGLRCAWLRFPFEGGERQVLVWQDTAPEAEYLRGLGWRFAGISLAGLAVTALLCYWLAGRAVRPIREAMERQEEFVAAASHELRGPLTVLQTGLALLPEAPTVALLQKEAARMGALVGELLLLAGGGRLQRAFAPRPLELDTLLIEFADGMTPVAAEAGLRLELRLPEAALPPVPGDENLLRRVLGILTENALRYAPPGSAVELALERRGRQCLLSVADHGCGVPEGEKERIFDRFYRGSASRTDPAHFGLGLAVARELAALHRGSLRVLDTPGGGATFQLALPL